MGYKIRLSGAVFLSVILSMILLLVLRTLIIATNSYSYTTYANGTGFYVSEDTSNLFWYLNPFRSTLNFALLLGISIFAPIISIIRLRETKNIKLMALAALSSIPIASSVFSLTTIIGRIFFALPGDEIGLVTSDDWKSIILWFCILIFGILFKAYAERENKAAGGKRSLWANTTHVLGVFLAAYAAAFIAVGLAQTVSVVDGYLSGLAEFSWVPEMPFYLVDGLIWGLIVAFGAYKLLEFSKNCAPSHPLAKFTYHSAYSVSGIIFLIGAMGMTAVLINEVSDAIYYLEFIRPNFIIMVGLLDAVFSYLAFTFFKMHADSKKKLHVLQTAHYWILVGALLFLVFGAYSGLFALYDLVGSIFNPSDPMDWRMGAWSAGIFIYGFALLIVGRSFEDSFSIESDKLEESVMAYFLVENDDDHHLLINTRKHAAKKAKKR